jgi:hypothetical protein
MPGTSLAVATSDNTAGGSILTLVIPLGLFVVIAVLIYLRIQHLGRRGTPAEAVVPAGAALPDPETARAAAVVAGLPTAAGGGAAESLHEPAGAARESAAAAAPGNVSGRDTSPPAGNAQEAGDPGPAGQPATDAGGAGAGEADEEDQQ